MLDTNPAIPAQAATPGNGEQGQPKPSAATAPATNNGTGEQSEGKVTISTKEYADLQRAKARSLSFDKRAQINASRNNPNLSSRTSNTSTEPGVAEALAEEQARADAAERRAMQLEVKDRVRDILAKPEYAALPPSTRDLILRNPAMLSEANNLDEAVLDIEDYIIDQVGKVAGQSNNGSDTNGTRPAITPGHETPAANASGPAPVKGNETEDISKLTGTARSRAILRNSIRAKQQGK